MTSQAKKSTQAQKADSLSVYVGEDKIDLAIQDLITSKQAELLASKTPQRYIKKRKGRGGQEFDYVEINYVIAKLNAIFGFNWDVETTKSEIGRNQVWVQVRLTVRLKDGTEIRKDAFGGSDVKKLRKSGEVINIADDLKAAQSDAIKKAASMLGVAWDVYSGIAKSANGKVEEAVPVEEDFSGNGYEEIDTTDAFRTIPLILSNGKKKMVTKFEAYKYCGRVKEQIGENAYYEVLGSFGYEHVNEVPEKELPKIYKSLLDAYVNMSEAEEDSSGEQDAIPF
jgi:hypothetical protein